MSDEEKQPSPASKPAPMAEDQESEPLAIPGDIDTFLSKVEVVVKKFPDEFNSWTLRKFKGFLSAASEAFICETFGVSKYDALILKTQGSIPAPATPGGPLGQGSGPSGSGGQKPGVTDDETKIPSPVTFSQVLFVKPPRPDRSPIELPFVNRDQQVYEVAWRMIANLSIPIADRQNNPLSLIVAAQAFGSGKTYFGLHFLEAVKRCHEMLLSKPFSAEMPPLSTLPKYERLLSAFYVGFQCSDTPWLGSVRATFNAMLYKALMLSDAISETARKTLSTTLANMPISTPCEVVAETCQTILGAALFVHVDEVDAFPFPSSSANPYEGFYMLWNEALDPLMWSSASFIYCSGRAPYLYLVGQSTYLKITKSPFAGKSPGITHCVILPSLALNHVELTLDLFLSKVLGSAPNAAHIKYFALLLYQWTGGVPRLLFHAISYLISVLKVDVARTFTQDFRDTFGRSVRASSPNIRAADFNPLLLLPEDIKPYYFEMLILSELRIPFSVHRPVTFNNEPTIEVFVSYLLNLFVGDVVHGPTETGEIFYLNFPRIVLEAVALSPECAKFDAPFVNYLLLRHRRLIDNQSGEPLQHILERAVELRFTPRSLSLGQPQTPLRVLFPWLGHSFASQFTVNQPVSRQFPKLTRSGPDYSHVPQCTQALAQAGAFQSVEMQPAYLQYYPWEMNSLYIPLDKSSFADYAICAEAREDPMAPPAPGVLTIQVKDWKAEIGQAVLLTEARKAYVPNHRSTLAMVALGGASSNVIEHKDAHPVKLPTGAVLAYHFMPGSTFIATIKSKDELYQLPPNQDLLVLVEPAIVYLLGQQAYQLLKVDKRLPSPMDFTQNGVHQPLVRLLGLQFQFDKGQAHAK